MILKALYDYYERCKDKLPAFGLELKEIGFIIVIDASGRFVRFEDKRIDKKQAQQFLVKKHVGRSSAPVANFLYDNSAYVFGYSDKSDMDTCRKYFEVFKKSVDEIYDALPGNRDLQALSLFYRQTPQEIISSMKSSPLWSEVENNLNKKYSNFS